MADDPKWGYEVREGGRRVRLIDRTDPMEVRVTELEALGEAVIVDGMPHNIEVPGPRAYARVSDFFAWLAEVAVVAARDTERVRDYDSESRELQERLASASAGEKDMAAVLMRKRLELSPVENLTMDEAKKWSGMGEPVTRAALERLVEWGVAIHDKGSELGVRGEAWTLSSEAREAAIGNRVFELPDGEWEERDRRIKNEEENSRTVKALVDERNTYEAELRKLEPKADQLEQIREIVTGIPEALKFDPLSLDDIRKVLEENPQPRSEQATASKGWIGIERLVSKERYEEMRLIAWKAEQDLTHEREVSKQLAVSLAAALGQRAESAEIGFPAEQESA